MLAAVLGGLVAFGFVVHAIVGAVWPRGTAGPISTGELEFTTRLARGVLRHWLVLPEEHYEVADYRSATSRSSPRRARARADRRPGLVAVVAARADALPGGIRLGEPARRAAASHDALCSSARILIVLMAARPQGLFGTPRVEIV